MPFYIVYATYYYDRWYKDIVHVAIGDSHGILIEPCTVDTGYRETHGALRFNSC